MRPQRILNLGDIHLFSNKSFHVHEYVFNEFYKQCEELKPDLIVVTGDVIDSKIRLAPEQISLCQNFFLNISNYCPVILILGNHDLLVNSKERLDSLSSIIYPLYSQVKHPIHFFKNSGVYNAYDTNWAVWSCLDDQQNPFQLGNWTDWVEEENYTIGLYHGVIKGAVAENGMRFSEGMDISEFSMCDIVMCSDLHIGEGFRNNEIKYTSSFIQTKVNETPDGKFVCWDWDGKTYIPTQRTVSNIYSTISYSINDASKRPDFKEIKNKTQVINIQYDPYTVTKTEINELKQELSALYENKIEIRPLVKKKAKKEIEEKVSEGDKSISIKELFENYITRNQESLGVREGDLDGLLALDNYYSSDLDISKDYDLGDFSIVEITLNNFLSYPPEDTVFDVSGSGLYSIVAENRSGKTNLIQGLKFALFNSVPNISGLKALINNENKEKEAYVILRITKNGLIYQVKRTLIPKKKGNTVSIDLDVSEVDENGNEIRSYKKEKRQETEKEILRLFGLESVFDILSFSSAQKRQIEFIDCKNAERLTLVNRFMGLQSFEQKDEHAAANMKSKKAVFAELSKDFNQTTDLKSLMKLEKAIKEMIFDAQSELEALKEELEDYILSNEQLVKQFSEISVLASKRVDSPEEIKAKIADLEIRISGFIKMKKEKERKIEDYKKNLIIQKEDFLAEIGEDIKTFKPNLKVNKEFEKELAVNESEIKRTEKQLNSDVCNSCGREFSEADKKECRELIATIEKVNEKIRGEIQKNENQLFSIIELQNDYNNTGRIISNLQSEAMDYQNKIINTENEKERLQTKKSEYEEVMKAKELLAVLKVSYEEYLEAKKDFGTKIFNKSVLIKEKENDLRATVRDIKVYKDKFDKLQVLEEEMRILKMYRSIINKDALPLYILKTKIDLINEQINLIVNQVFDYSVEFVIDEDAGDLDIEFFYDEDKSKTDAALASGSETFIMNLCIKVGLAQVSELPKADTLFIDEGFGTLDKKRIDKMPNLFDALNEFYRNVITISHLDELKDMSTHQIRLRKEGKYTRVV